MVKHTTDIEVEEEILRIKWPKCRGGEFTGKEEGVNKANELMIYEKVMWKLSIL